MTAAAKWVAGPFAVKPSLSQTPVSFRFNDNVLAVRQIEVSSQQRRGTATKVAERGIVMADWRSRRYKAGIEKIPWMGAPGAECCAPCRMQ